jgi:HK97 family phage portal protein
MAVVISGGQLARIDRATWSHAAAGVGLSLYNNRCQDYETLYRTQSNVKLVVDFLARNVSQLNLKVFRRLSDTDREHLPNHELSRLIARPNPWTARFDFFNSLLSDYLIFGNSYTLKVKPSGAPTQLWRLPPQQVKPLGEYMLRADSYEWRGLTGAREFAAQDVIHLKSYNPTDPRVGLPPLEALRRILAEDAASGEYREYFWKNRARAEVVLKHPGTLGAGAGQRLREEWKKLYTGPESSGQTAILEEGMDVSPISSTWRDTHYLEVRKLTREECAVAFHIPPPMVGLLDRATYSNISEQAKMLYRDTLAPTLKHLEDNFQLQLLPEFADRANVYCEFDIAAKLRGDFVDQAAQLQTAVGGPYMSRNEARARLNLPRLDDADALIVPMNVTEGGQASPTDSAPPPKHLPAYVPDELDERAGNGTH